ncbi:MAG: O-antigen ligase family protein [Actinobacteria bacterium]|nr:O-antigen ligase family protein [Actinomycetota bacterium]
MPATLLAAGVLAAALLAGGYYESTYSLLAAAAWLGLAAAYALRPLPGPPAAALALLALAGLTALSALWGQPGAALRTAPLPALYAAALWAASLVDRETLLRRLRQAVLLVAAAGLAAKLSGLAPEAAGPGSDRLAWPVTYANGLGLVAVTGTLLSFLPGLSRRSALAGGTLCTTVAVLTYSRSALLAGAAGLALVLGRRARVPAWAAVAAALALGAVAVALAQPLAARFAAPAPDERDARRLLDVSGHGRTELWRIAWDEGLERPLAGSGAGTWARAAIADRATTALPANAHSLPLETFAELGLAGVALLAAFLVFGLRATWAEPAALAIVVAWALQATADWAWQLPAATLPAVLCAGALSRRGPPLRAGAALAVAVAALAVGAAAGLHGVGAALLESGSRSPAATRLLPWDARPWVARGDLARACEVDPAEPALLRADHPLGGCALRP